jgi:hypothetical protein
MKSQLIALAAAALLASISGASLAQDAPASTTTTTTSTTTTATGGNSAVRAACAADFAKTCPGVTDRAAMRQCVMDNFSSLSDGCKTAIQAMQAQMQSSGAGH